MDSEGCTSCDVINAHGGNGIAASMRGKEFFIMRLLFALSLACATVFGAANEPQKRLQESAVVFSEIMSAPDKGIPRDLLEKAHCIVIVPALKKGAFIVGGQYGKGYLSCRNGRDGAWSAPGSVRIEGGSVGLQIGGSETDLIMLVMNRTGADKLLSSEFTLGAEGEVAAGPVGRTTTAETDALMRAEILSWSRSRGVFAGIALKGATLRQDLDDNQALYGRKIENRQVVDSGVSAPPAATRLLTLLGQYPSRMTS
jgi:SH3 domain-containing YSC84-like protein 1